MGGVGSGRGPNSREQNRTEKAKAKKHAALAGTLSRLVSFSAFIQFYNKIGTELRLHCLALGTRARLRCMLRCFSFVSTALSHALSSHPHPSPDPRLDSTHVRLHAVRHPLSCLRPPASAEDLSPRVRPVVFAVWSLEALLHAMPPYVPEACSTSREGGYMALLFARLLRRPGVKGCLMQNLQQPCSLPEPPWLHCPCPTWMGHRGMCDALHSHCIGQ